MSSSNVLQLLHLAYHGGKEERTTATVELEAVMQSPTAAPGALLALLRAGVDPSVPAEQSLSALLYAKNALLHSISDDVVIKTPDFLTDMETVLFTGMFTAAETHRRVLRACIVILISGFEWNFLGDLIPFIERDLNSVPLEASLAALELLYTYVKRFKTPGLVPMPLKLEVCALLVRKLPEYTAYNDMRIFRFVFKLTDCIAETGLQLTSAKDMNGSALDSLFQLMLAFPQQHYEAAHAAGGKVYAEYVKCMKRIAMVAYSVINDATRRKKPAPVAKHFLRTHSAAFLNTWRQWLLFCVSSTDRHTHQKSEMFAIRYVKLCTLDETLYTEQLRPQAMMIVEQLLFPYLCFNEEDEEVFADDSDIADYVQYMMEEGFGNAELSTRQAASNTILALLGTKKKFHDSAALLQALLGVLTNGFESADVTTPAGNARLFGFLHLLSILRKFLKEVPEIWQGQMAQVLMRYVAPCLQPTMPSVGVRCKAVVVCQRYSKVPMPSENDFASFMHMMCGLIEDREVRVRLAGIDAMCTLLEMKRARPYLGPILVPLVEECLTFLSKVQTTFVPTVILHLATHFAPELAPVMGKLGHTLVQHLLATMHDMDVQESHSTGALGEDLVDVSQYEQAAFSADALMDAIFTVVTSCRENEAAFVTMRPDVVHLVRHVLEQPDNFDIMEKTLSIFLHVVYFSKPIPQECWDLLPLVFRLVESGIGVDFFVSIEEVMDNFISGAPVEFLSNTDLMNATYTMCEKMLIGGVVCVPECQMAPAQLIEAMLHTAKANTAHPGLFDPYLPKFVGLLLQSLLNPDIQSGDVRIRIWIIAALMDCFYYNAAVTFGVLVQANAYPSFFDGLLYFLRGCWQDGGSTATATAGSSSTISTSGSTGRKKKMKKDDAGEVLEHLSLLTRKVTILGLSSLLAYATDPTVPAATAPSQREALVSQYQGPLTRIIQYCVFTNEETYGPRCTMSEANLQKIKMGIEDEVEDYEMNDEAVLGVDGGDDTIEAYEDLSGEDQEDALAAAAGGDVAARAGLDLDEGDDYESPIDDINEVEFFLSWVRLLPQLPLAVQAQAQATLRPESDFIRASHTAQRYRELCKALDVAMKEDFQTRAEAVLGA
jgi:importin-7